MSYIRCLSNPELLYIWQGSDRKVYITHGVKYPLARLGVKNYRDNPAQFTVPFHIFRDAIKKWDKYGFGKVTYRGFTIEEIEIYSDTLKEVKKKNRPFSEMIKRPSEYRIKISYKDSYVCLWQVTWEHVINSLLES